MFPWPRDCSRGPPRSLLDVRITRATGPVQRPASPVIVSNRMLEGSAKAWVRAAIFVFISTAVPATGRAADPNQVEELIKEGIALRRAGSDGKALPFFQKAYELAHTPRTAAQLGLVEFALGYALEAERHLGQGLATPSDPWIARNRQVLDDALTKVRTTIGEIIVTGSPDGAEVLLNGHPAGTVPLAGPLRVSQGPATVELRASGYVAASSSVEVKGGETSKVALLLNRDVPVAAVPAASPVTAGTDIAAPPAATSPSSTRTIVGWSLVGAGAVALVAGGVVLATTSAGCTTMPGFECSHTAPSKTPGWIILGAGAATGIAGGIVLLTRPKAGVEVGILPSGAFLRGVF